MLTIKEVMPDGRLLFAGAIGDEVRDAVLAGWIVPVVMRTGHVEYYLDQVGPHCAAPTVEGRAAEWTRSRRYV